MIFQQVSSLIDIYSFEQFFNCSSVASLHVIHNTFGWTFREDSVEILD